MDEQITDIIARKFQGTATEQELTALQQWLEASETNRREYEQLQLFWNKGAELFQSTSFNTQDAWEKVDKTIRKKEKKGPSYSR